ncbi:protein GVQW3-like [Rhopalosiphum maidis]|uniref:protein GVQW3-like n=1 Tax=Rhopalosiphum maidis TaxID=43146 RepID=UPI000EFF02D8|nr:protein GVQW3-like [Rhopalosiphum maidis]
MSRSKTFEWHKRFIEGREDINDDSRAGRPSTSRNVEMVAKVQTIIRSDRRMTIKELSSECNISIGSCQTILTEDLGMRRVCAKMVPKLLSQDQKNHRIEVCQSLKERIQNDPGFIKNVITGDETWIYGYDIETKRQSSQWKSVTSPRPKKARQLYLPYSPDLAPYDFFLFPKIKTDLKGQRFDDIETIKKNAVDQLKQLKVEDFQHCFKKWQERRNKCITSGDEYFEAD